MAIGAFTERLLAASDETQLAAFAAESLASAFDADVAILLPLADGTIGVVSRVDLSISRWVFDRGQPAGLGTDTLPSAARHYVPLLAGQRCYGVLALAPHELRRLVLPEPRRALEQCARQVAVALERHQRMAHSQDCRLAAQEESLRNALLSGISHVLRTPYLRLYMSQLRQKLEPDPTNPQILIMEQGFDYRLAESKDAS